MSNGENIKIGEAKGRPMLHWVGKQSLDYVKAFPAQKIEVFNPLNEENYAKGLLFHGDNKDVLAWLLANGYRGKVNLIYIDPPFDSGADYIRQVYLRNSNIPQKIFGESYSLGEQIQYTDIWTNDSFLQFFYERLILLHELLSDNGSIWVHCDYRKNSHIRILMDEIFGSENFRSELIWKHTRSKSTGSKNFGVEHNTLFYYVKSDEFIWNLQFKDYDSDKLDRYYSYFEQPDGSYVKFTKSEMRDFRLRKNFPKGRRFALIPLLNLNKNRPNLTYEFKGFIKTWAVKKKEMLKLDDKGLIVQTDKDTIPQKKQYFDEMKGIKVGTIWDQIFPVNSQASQRTDYPTQKPEELLERIIESTSITGSIVLDCFVGSGTTAAVAQKLGRRWIAADINKGAIQTTSKRLQSIIQEQISEKEQTKQATLDLVQDCSRYQQRCYPNHCYISGC